MELFIDSFLNLFAGPALGGIVPLRFLYLILGTVVGLLLGVLPGLGGVVGLALLLPFTFNMDPYMAFALMVAMTSVTTTSDTITSVFFAVPGSVGSSATILDGHPMAKKGQAGRALGAAYMASLLGGLIGALMLFLAIPILRPVLMLFAAPEFLMLAVLGLVVVGSLTGDEPVKGLLAAALGLVIGLIGMERFNGIPRWTFGELYLWDGVSVVVVGLGLFAIPEIIDMIISGKSISQSETKSSKSGVLQGVVDVFRHWFLMLRCGLMGAFLGALPGIGVSLINWLAYGHALQTEKGAKHSFGKGDVRGVIAPESSNNAKEGGSLLPTLAFGIPGSPSAAILLGGFIIHGIAPGPNMLTTNLDLTYTMIWALVVANILGTSLCLWSTNLLVKIATVRINLIAPLIIVVVCLGAYQATKSFSDLVLLVIVSLLGWVMKRLGWPRPPLLLGLVLAGILENNFFISYHAYGIEWLARPVVVFALLGSVLTIFFQVRAVIKKRRKNARQENKILGEKK